MDITVMRNKAAGWIRKYRFVLIVLLVGVLLMLIPTDYGKGRGAVDPLCR